MKTGSAVLVVFTWKNCTNGKVVNWITLISVLFCDNDCNDLRMRLKKTAQEYANLVKILIMSIINLNN